MLLSTGSIRCSLLRSQLVKPCQTSKTRGVADGRASALSQIYSFGPSWLRIEPLAYRARALVQRPARPLVADDKRVHFKNKAWQIQKDMTACRLHETYKKRSAAWRSIQAFLEDGQTRERSITTTKEAQRKQRWQKHFFAK